MAMKPSQLIEEFCYASDFPGERPGHQRPAGKQYQPRNTGPPSYVEEHRMINTIWRIQLLYEMASAQQRGDIWSGAEGKLEPLDFLDFYHLPLFQADQIRSVLDYLEEVKGWNDQASDRFSLPAITTANTFNWPMSPLQCSRDKRSIGETPNSIPMGYRFFRVLVTDYRSPLRYLPFAPYRKYGFAFWDTKRMVDLGFMPTPAAMHPLLLTELYFTWRSILSKEEDEMAWGEQQARGL